jgi:uncharacterized phage protein gp47/JayE
LYGSEGTVILGGTNKIRQDRNDAETYTLQDDVTIGRTTTARASIAPDTPSPGGGEVYDVTIDSVLYTYTADPGDTVAAVIDALVSSITGGSWGGTASNDNDTYLDLEDTVTSFDLDFSATWALNVISSPGLFSCDVDGPIPAPTGTLIIIVTPISGWDSVTNPNAGILGRDVETDSEFRSRREQSLLSGNGTDEAIRANVLNNVDGVTSCSVTSNRTLVTDGEGRPAKSFETIVIGGTDQDIGDEIWTSMPSGIEPYGDIAIVVVDSEGRNQDVNFSRPVDQYIHVRVKRDFYAEESYPADGDDQIKDAIVAWAATEYDLGKDVIRQRISIPVYSVPGVGEIEIAIDATANPGDPPTYALVDIPISAKEIAVFDTSRILVEALTP